MSQPSGIVFVVDDDPSVRKAAARLFRSAGLQAETFETARDFLDYPRPDLPSCLVLDVQMPGLSGIELQKQLGAHDDLPIVFMTGHGDIPIRGRDVEWNRFLFHDGNFGADLERVVRPDLRAETILQRCDHAALGCRRSCRRREGTLQSSR